MFFDKLSELCQEKGITVTQAAREIGYNAASNYYWKKSGATPTFDILEKIAKYFGVTIAYLSGETDIKSPQPTSEDDELLLLLDELRNRPDMKMLFSVSKKCTPDEVRQAVKIIEALRKDDSANE